MSSDRSFYVYAHHRDSDGRLFYIGKGKDRRAWARAGRNRQWSFVERKHGFRATIIRGDMLEACALTFERIAISANRSVGLANCVDGGGGTTGWRHSPETKARIGAYWKGRKLTPAMRAALDKANTERVFTDEVRAKMSAAAKVRTRAPHSDETRAKIAAAHRGMKASDQARLNMSRAKIGKAVGRESSSYDHTIRHFENANGETFTGTRADFIQQFGLRPSCVSTLISGKQKTVKGWRLAQSNPTRSGRA